MLEAAVVQRRPAQTDRETRVVYEKADALWARLGTLGRKQRAVLVLRYYEQLDDNAIAELIGCTPATVRSQASKALKTLRLSSEREQLVNAEETS